MESKKYNKLMNITKKMNSRIQRTNQRLPVGRGEVSLVWGSGRYTVLGVRELKDILYNMGNRANILQKLNGK